MRAFALFGAVLIGCATTSAAKTLPERAARPYIGAAEVPPPGTALLRAATGLIERFLDEP